MCGLQVVGQARIVPEGLGREASRGVVALPVAAAKGGQVGSLARAVRPILARQAGSEFAVQLE